MTPTTMLLNPKAYLKSIWELDEDGVHVIQARLAEHVGHAAPTVSEMIRRLRSEGYVEVKDRRLQLTANGEKRAVSLVRKHRLAERLLSDIIGMPWHRAHMEACRWERVISDEVETRLVVLLGNPPTCPHGNPIPGAGAPERVLSALAEATSGDRVRLERVSEQVEADLDALVYLDSNGFVPGATGDVRSKAPDGTVTIDLEGIPVAFGPTLAGQLFVAKA